MICRITRSQIAIVTRFVISVSGRERSQPVRCQQAVFCDVHDGLPARRVKHRVFQRDGKQLVWPACRIGAAVFRINDVVKVLAFLIPEPLVEGRRARWASSANSSALRSGCGWSCNQDSRSRRALYQSALISTALPRLGVTTQSSTLASIHVN